LANIRITLACAVVALASTVGSGIGFAQTAPQAVPVGVIAAARQPVTSGVDFVGRVEATDKVAIRARVIGFLDQVNFTEGSLVKAGDKLFSMDRVPFEAALLQTQGAVLQASATLENATLQRARADELVKTNAISVATRDERLAAERTAQGSLIRAQADVKTASINLSYTEMLSPIDGRIGRTALTRGNLVGPDSGVLATVVSQDPMSVVFPVSQREFLALQKKEDSAATKAGSLLVKLRFSDGSTYPQDGRIDFVDVTIDRATDTVQVRATVPNPKDHLVDGQFVRVSVQGETPVEKLVIPQAALIADQEGIYVFVVDGGKAVVRRVKTGTELGPNIAVEQGLAEGDQVVVTGLAMLRPGVPVMASPLPASLGAAKPAGG